MRPRARRSARGTTTTHQQSEVVRKRDLTLLCQEAAQAKTIADKLLSGGKVSALDWGRWEQTGKRRSRNAKLFDTGPGPGHYAAPLPAPRAKGVPRMVLPGTFNKQYVRDGNYKRFGESRPADYSALGRQALSQHTSTCHFDGTLAFKSAGSAA